MGPLGEAVFQFKKIAQSVGWAFEERPTGSKYLTQKRLKRKVIASTFENTSFRGKSVREWIDLYKKGGEWRNW